jgi:hypothetical protein
MTGAYLMAERDGERQPVEVEFLTDEEIDEKFLTRSPEELVSWVKLLCKALRNIDPLLKDLERDGIIQLATDPAASPESPETL